MLGALQSKEGKETNHLLAKPTLENLGGPCLMTLSKWTDFFFLTSLRFRERRDSKLAFAAAAGARFPAAFSDRREGEEEGEKI